MSENDEDLLKTILLNMRYVNEPNIERFLNNYRLGKQVFETKPYILCDLMKHMFGPNQGETAFELFNEVNDK